MSRQIIAAACLALPLAVATDAASANASDYSGRFPYGYCTWYAAQHHHVTWLGMAGEWLTNAQAQGVPTSSEPTPGAIVVYGPGRGYSGYGHVAIVESVNDDGTFAVSEMNYGGWGQVDTRASTMAGVEGFIT
jgi:surface antigen